MAEVLTGINGSLIQWAREYCHMSPEEAAKAIGIDVERLKKWERGEDYPTYSKLKVISRVFHKPSALFFFPEPPSIQPPIGELRTLSHEVVDRFSSNIVVQFDKAAAYQISLEELYGNRYCIFSEKSLFPTKMEDLCKYLREKMEFPIQAQKARKSTKVVFEIFREKFYQLGIYVFKDSFKDNTVSGLCIYDEVFPVIVINNAMSFARQIFTLFHELYHLINETNGAEIINDDYYQYLNHTQCITEKECDEFANMFLVPEDDFNMELKKAIITEERIVELSCIYSVSREAIMYKLLQRRLISTTEYSMLKESFYGEALREKSKNGEKGGGNYYASKLAYLGRQFTGEVFNQYFSGKIDGAKAGEMLNSRIDHLPKLEIAFYRGVKA